jgi:phage shock protein C
MTATTHPHVNAYDASLSGARAWFSQKGLSRPREGRVLAGVSAGFARRFKINLLVARLLGIATILVLSPIVYIALWILMPRDAEVEPSTASTA